MKSHVTYFVFYRLTILLTYSFYSSYLSHMCSWLRDISLTPDNMIRCDQDQHSAHAHRSENALNIWCRARTRRPRSIRGTEGRPGAEQADLIVLQDIVQSAFVPSVLTSSPSLRSSSDNDLPSSPEDRFHEPSSLLMTNAHLMSVSPQTLGTQLPAINQLCLFL